ncbi:MAG TPA: hypothetical protein VEZ11_09295 [Thermoanaerobaculia bacterium]|nr:hypothetical protein [Thermoanaerobaculia bacterium]
MPSIATLYDRYASRLFAVALRIVDDRKAAADVIEEVFLEADPNASEAALIRLTRERALGRGRRDAAAAGASPTPRQLVEDAFYGGRSVTELSARYALPEQAVRSMLRDGMVQLRREFADGGRQ